ncbi:MAG: MBL fold metallo-hydrolase [Patescibacteria group bacterium]
MFFSKSRLNRLEVDLLDVGQGDAALIKIPGGKVILIDGGPDNLVLRRLGEILPFYRRRIDLIILSHYHDDHAAGLVEIVKRYKVKDLVYPAGSPPTAIMEALRETAVRRKTTIRQLETGVIWNFGVGCSLALFNPASLGVKKDANNSLVARLACDRQTFLFAGDNSKTVEKALIASGRDLTAAVLKASHHGSNSANSEEFLRAVNPRVMVVSVGADNKFGHPNPEVLELAAVLKITVERTDELGSILILDRF